MDTIKRINFDKSMNDMLDFEIVDLKEFYQTRSMKHLSKVYRLDFYIMIYVTSGRGKHEIDFEVYNFKEGDLIFIAKNQVHRFISISEASGYIILFTEEFLYIHSEININDFLSHFTVPFYKPVIYIDVSKSQTNRILIDLIYKEYQIENNTFKKQLLKSLFRSFILTLYESINYDEKKELSIDYKRFLEFKNLVDRFYKEKKTVLEYANIMLISQKTINQTTRKIVGLSAKGFIINRILLESKRYLSQGELTVNEISELMGFDEPSNFTKFFKRYEGSSPNKFKKKYFDN